MFLNKLKDVKFDEDIKRTKELERKQWLKELEDQKREKLLNSSLNHSNTSKFNNNSSNAPATLNVSKYPRINS